MTTPPRCAIISLKFHQREAGRCAAPLAEHDRAKDGALAPALSCRCERVLPLFAAGILCFAFLTKKLAAYICGRRMSASFVYDVTMTLGGKRYSVKGYLDSGNRLTSDGLPVIIATSGRMRNAVARQAAEDLLGGRARYAEYSTLAGGTRKMPVVECGDITVGGRRLNALVGAAGKTTAAFGCEVLLGAWMDTDGGEK